MYCQWIASYMLGSLGPFILINLEYLEEMDHKIIKIVKSITEPQQSP